jgi:hypothetical protein
MVAEEYNCGEEVDLRRIHKEQEKMEKSSGNEYSLENYNSLYQSSENDKVLK